MFRFNHPAQAAKLRQELKGSSVNLTRLSSLGQSVSDLARSTENLALITSGLVCAEYCFHVILKKAFVEIIFTLDLT